MKTVTMKAPELAKKLRAKLKQEQAKRVGELSKYNKDCDAWRIAVRSWLTTNGAKQVNAITNLDLIHKEGPNWDSHGRIFSEFFNDAPRAPRYPSDERIRKIQKVLKFLTITGVTTFPLEVNEAEALFGDEPISKDDHYL